MEDGVSPVLMLMRPPLVIYVSGRAASLLHSHSNESLTVGGRRCRKPNRSKSVYTYKVTSPGTWLSLIDEYCLHSWVPFSSLTCRSIYPPHLFLPVSFSQSESLGFRGVRGLLMSDQRWLFLCHRRQRCMPTQLHCELEDCVISIIHCSLFPQSILCPAPVPRFGRKCSLKASPPTAEEQRSQSAAKILHTDSRTSMHSLASGWTGFMSALLQIPIPQSLVPWKLFTITHLIYMHNTKRSCSYTCRSRYET